LTIGEVARRAGVRTSAIRYWEDEGVLPPPRRVGGQRRYDEAVLARLAVVRLAQEVGFSVADVRALVEGFEAEGVAPARWRELAQRKLVEIDALIDRAEGMKRLLEESLGCGCLTLDACELVLVRQRGDGGAATQPAGRSTDDGERPAGDGPVRMHRCAGQAAGARTPR
jgi:MerR family redox-sensitive transcriptional activator SoxR